MSSIAAIDIGSTKAVTVIAELDTSGAPRVVAVGQAKCNGLKRGTVVDIEETARAVVESIRKAEQMANRKITDVVVSITGDHLHSKPSKGLVPILNPSRTITREDVHRVINHSKQIVLEGERELILAVPRAFKVDGNDGVSRPIGMSGERLEVSTLLITGLTTHLENLEKCVSRAQVEAENFVPQHLATGLAVASPTEKEMGVAIIDIGGGTTDVAVYTDGSIAFIGMVPIGSRHITSDISILLKTSTDEAERIKLEGGTCLPDSVGERDAIPVEQVGSNQRRPFAKKALAEIVAARTKEILQMVKNEVAGECDIERLGAGAILTGGGSKLAGAQEFAESILGVPVRVGKPEQLAGLGDMLAGPEYSTAVGLVKYAFKSREDESVAAEAGDWRKLFGSIKSIFAPRSREEIK
jgi:cell division protein FtsA